MGRRKRKRRPGSWPRATAISKTSWPAPSSSAAPSGSSTKTLISPKATSSPPTIPSAACFRLLLCPPERVQEALGLILEMHQREAEIDPLAERTVEELLRIARQVDLASRDEACGRVWIVVDPSDRVQAVAAVVPTGDEGLLAQGYLWTFGWLLVRQEAQGHAETARLLTEATKFAAAQGARGLVTMILDRNRTSGDRARRAGFRPYRTDWVLELNQGGKFWSR